MKRFALFILIGLAVALQGCLTPPGTMIQFSGIEPGTEPGKGAPRNMAVEEVEGKAEIRIPGETTWRELHPGAEVPVGARVRTRSGGKVILVIPDNASRLAVNPNSEIQLQLLEAPVVGDPTALHVRIQVFRGDLGGGFRSQTSPSTLEIVYPDGQVMYTSVAPGSEMNVQMAVTPIAAPEIDFSNFGMHPNFSVNVLAQIPEPTSILLALAGAGVILGRVRRRV